MRIAHPLDPPLPDNSQCIKQVYAEGSARPTGGAGAVAMLVGPKASFVMDPVRCSHMKHTHDFCKPDMSSDYPVVDGRLSILCYMSALEKCYEVRHRPGKCDKIRIENGSAHVNSGY